MKIVKPVTSVTKGRPYRRAIPALLCLIALCAAVALWARPTASADSGSRKSKTRRQQINSDGSTQGFAQEVGNGVIVPVSDLMAAEKKNPTMKTDKVRFTKEEYEFMIEYRERLKNRPDSPAVASWPPSDKAQSEVGTDNVIRNAPQTVGNNFLGVASNEAGGFVPPDSHGAVGPTQVVVAVNTFMRSFNKTTGVADGVLNLSLGNFFSPVSGGAGLSDPRVKFDPISRRWFISIITTSSTNKILLAVSSGPDITSASSFTFFSFNATDGGGAESQTPFADYDTLGVDAKGVYIGANMFNTAATSLLGSTMFVINKANLLATTPTLTVTAFRQLNSGSTPGAYTPYVADNPDPTATEAYLVGVDNASFGLLVLHRITGADTATPTLSAGFNLTVPATAAPLNVTVQGRTQAALDALDDRLYEAKVRNGRLWTAHNIQVDATGAASSTGGRTGSRWYEIGNLSTTPTLIQSGTLFSNAATNADSFWIPSIGITGQGHAALACSAAGPARFPEIVTAGRLNGDALGTLQTPVTAVTSTTSYTVTANRWGDYSHVATDPNDDMTMWTFQEYAPSTSTWGVRAIQLLAPPPATVTSISPTSATQGQTLNITVNGTSSNGSGFYNPPATFPNRLSANFGTGVTVNSVTFNSPTQAVFNVTVAGGATTGTRNVTVTNPDGQSSTGNNLFTVNTGCANPITISPASLPNGITGNAYTQSITASGGTAPYTFSVAGGTLPTGLSLTGGGLSGIPTAGGTFIFTVLATDSSNCTGSQNYSVTIGAPSIGRDAVTVTTGNNLIEPNECNSLTVGLFNTGTAAASNVTATLSTTTPGVTVAVPTSAYPTLATGGVIQTNTTAFQVSTSNSIACFSTIDFTLTVTFTGGSASFNFSRMVGQPAGTNYAFTSTTGTIPSGGTLVANSQGDDVTAAITIPAGFSFSVHGTTFNGGTTITASSNGNLQMAGSGTNAFANLTLPVLNSPGTGVTGTFPANSPTVFPYWDDLDLSSPGNGIFTNLVGTAPNRQFIVEWRGVIFNTTNTVNFAVVFTENSNNVSFIYNNSSAANGGSATIGIQAAATGTTFTQFSFNTASLTNGQRLNAAFPAAVCTSGTGPCVTCTYQVAPTSATIPARPTSGSITVTTGTGCTWTAVSNAPWLSIISGASGSGNGTVQVRSTSNESASARVGTLTVAGQTVTITQSRPNASTPGQFRPSNGFVYVRNTNDTGFADREFFYGVASDVPVAGDWNGDGVDTIGIYRNGTFFLRNSNNSGFADIQFPFGAAGDIPIVGDWDGDGVDTIGIVRGNAVFLRNSNTSGNADIQFNYGNSTDIFITGDWNGDGIDTIGCFRPTNGFVYIRNSNTTGIAESEFFYGLAGDRPVVGDWNGDGIDTIGIVRGNQWFLRNSNTSGFADIQFFYGNDTDTPIAGDWDGLP